MSGAETEPTADLALPADPLPGGTVALPARYEDRGLIAAGGMGEVRRVFDRVLQRELAMKLIREELMGDTGWTRRFEAEARLTGHLQHPGIIAVHDLGRLDDGRLWFTMPEVRGRTLRALIRQVHAGTARPEWTTHRLLDTLLAACHAVAFAHARAVVHRDLKPANIMVGTHGEVRVMDWGIAERTGSTLDAGAAGTGAWRAPEVRAGAPATAASDVYALGVILYEILRGTLPPVDSTARWSAEPLPPAELVTLCDRALAPAPAARPADASAVAEALRRWLDGEQRRALGREKVAEADALYPELRALHQRARQLREGAARALADVAPHDPEPRKWPAWDLEAEAEAIEQQAGLLEVRFLQTLRSALNHDPELALAHTRLADHYRDEHARAERRGDPLAAARAEALLCSHDRGRHAAWLRGLGALTLHTDPPGAEVVLHRYVRRRKRWIAEPVRSLGPTPLDRVPLERGRWLLSIQAPGHVPVSYPIFLERGAHWDGAPPGDTEPAALRLPREGALPESVRVVPAGWARCGGDPLALDGLSERRIWIDSFALGVAPVTVADWLAFLDDTAARHGVEAALRHAPRERAGTTDGETRPLVTWEPGRGFAPTPEVTGLRWRLDWPVSLVDLPAVQAWLAWYRERTGLPWRLPHDHEWEKAARGVDGRAFPWGDHLDPTWTTMGTSHAGTPARSPVATHPVDVSPYGVLDLGGNVRDWCCNAYQREGPVADGHALVIEEATDDGWRMTRGGSWSSAADYCRAASRFVARPGDRLSSLGFRVALSL